MPLSEKHRRFVAEYLKDLNGAQAAIRAGYSASCANVTAAKLVANPNISAAIAAGQQKICNKLEITAERVLNEIALLGFANMDDYVDTIDDKRVLNTGKATRDQMAAVCEITEDTTGGSGDGERKAVLRTKFKLVDKGANLERLGRHLKLFTDRIEMKVEGDLAEQILMGRRAVQSARNGPDDRERGS